MAPDSPSQTDHVQVSLTLRQIRSLFAAINTAGALSAGRIQRQDPLASDLCEAIASLEQASGVEQAQVDEWLLD